MVENEAILRKLEIEERAREIERENRLIALEKE